MNEPSATDIASRDQPASDVTRCLVRYLVKSRIDDIPHAVRHEASRTLVNWTGCAIGGAGHETISKALEALAQFAGKPQATVVGRNIQLDIMHAALMNGMSSHLLDFDDTDFATLIHPGAPVVPAIFALAEWRKASGSDFVHALILGIEAACRIGDAVCPAHYDAGWFITSTAGVIGAAVGAGKLLGLNEQQMTWAVGLAATQAAGLRAMNGTMAKSFNAGRAAQTGLVAALLAEQGFTSSERSIEGRRGFVEVLSTTHDVARITKGLGERFAIQRNGYKPFANGLVVNPVIDGCIQLREHYKLSPAQIERVMLKVHPIVFDLTSNKTPTNGLEAKFSVYHSAAVALIYGDAGEEQYSDGCVQAPEVGALRARVSAAVLESLGRDEAHIEIRLIDGRTVTKYIQHAIGSPENPMSDRDLERKFRGLARHLLSEQETLELNRMCWSVESLPDVGAIARKSLPPKQC